ncbi:unnamed protein product [Lasius platythorax]|uniref:Uncharacterized protein n=1 Tax=Lasius platythorax TaxID=488582 RepID=A0AAV2NSK6_9HYME
MTGKGSVDTVPLCALSEPGETTFTLVGERGGGEPSSLHSTVERTSPVSFKTAAARDDGCTVSISHSTRKRIRSDHDGNLDIRGYRLTAGKKMSNPTTHSGSEIGR